MLSFHVKFVQTDRRLDRPTDRRTTVKQYALLIFRYGGHKNMTKVSLCQIHRFIALTFHHMFPSFKDPEVTSIFCFPHNVFSHVKDGNHYLSNIKFDQYKVRLLSNNRLICNIVIAVLSKLMTQQYLTS